MRRVRVTTVVVEKQYLLHILSTCLQPYISSMQMACAVLRVYWHLWPVRLYNILPHYVTRPTVQYFPTLCDPSGCTIFSHIMWPVRLYNILSHYVTRPAVQHFATLCDPSGCTTFCHIMWPVRLHKILPHYVTRPAVQYFPTLCHKRHNFRKKIK